MKQIISAFGTLIILVLNIFVCISVSTVSGSVAEAKEYKADVIAEIENSNFNPHVIHACITQAQAEGYGLEIKNASYDADGNIQTAEVVLTYQYTMPLFGISETKTTRGTAR